MTDVVVTRRIAASPATVFSFFTDRERWVLWQGVDAEIDAQSGGVFRVRMPGAQVASGQFIEFDPPRRLSFTWGWRAPSHRWRQDQRPSSSNSSPMTTARLFA